MAAPVTLGDDAFARRFASALARLPVEHWSRRRVWVALSGGLDSTVLLHALHRFGGLKLRALHVDHGLQAESGTWARHCAALAGALGIDCVTRSLNLSCAPGQSLEAVAREARYAALAQALDEGDVMMTAHHADDQLETVLLRLLRGTGVRGLTAIHEFARFGRGLLARPLLEFSRAEIEAQARAWRLEWLDDPSNRDLRFDRNYLRARVLPGIRERWPQAGPMAARLARQMGEAELLLSDLARADLAAADPTRIPLTLLRGLSAARQRNALRGAARALGLPVPTAAQLAEIVRSLDARPDAEAVVAWPGAEARLYRDHLYLMTPKADRLVQAAGHAAPGEPLARLDTRQAWSGPQGRLRLVATEGYGIPNRWAEAGLTVAFRAGGERFRPRGSRHHKTLKHWFQETGIVPWMRGDVPLLYREGRLVAVADLCLSDDLPHGPGDAPFWRPEWTEHGRLH